MKKRLIPRNQLHSGFSMVELLITMVISAIVIAAIYSAYKFQRDTFEAQDQVTEMQQNIRAALWYMAPEIRMAGHDPTHKAKAGITEAKKNRFGFTMDITDNVGTGGPDEDTGDANEQITLGFSDANDPNSDGIIAGSDSAPLGRNTGGGFQPISENIVAIEFNYVLEDGSTKLAPTSFEITKIRSVEISILARARYEDKNFKNSNMTYQTAAGTIWGPYNDNYRRLLLTTRVEGRNLGL